jgi:hypothetical protein
VILDPGESVTMILRVYGEDGPIRVPGKAVNANCVCLMRQDVYPPPEFVKSPKVEIAGFTITKTIRVHR